MTEALRRFPDGLPDQLLELDALPLLRELGRPTLIRVPGHGDLPPRAITTLLHGDESTGLQATLRILRRRRREPFDLYVVLGNVQAAAEPPGFAHRYLDGQEDMNRIFDGAPTTTAQREATEAIRAELLASGLAALVDVHNNTGNNPFYAIVTNDRPATLNLATLLTTTVVRWEFRLDTLLDALDERVVTCALECGLPGRSASLRFAVDALRRYLGEDHLPTDRLQRDADVLGRLRRVTVHDDARVRFGGVLDGTADLVLPPDGDVHNFTEVSAGHLVGYVPPTGALPVSVTDADGRDVTADSLAREGDRLVLTRDAVPIMMTRSEDAVRRDCLFYLAEPLPSLSNRT